MSEMENIVKASVRFVLQTAVKRLPTHARTHSVERNDSINMRYKAVSDVVSG